MPTNSLRRISDTARGIVYVCDAVFSGTAVRYYETCSPDPTTPYGAAKAAAETAIKGLDPTAVIARTSLIIGDGGSAGTPFLISPGFEYDVESNAFFRTPSMESTAHADRVGP